MRKRILGILLALTMVFSMMSAMTVTSFAATDANKTVAELQAQGKLGTESDVAQLVKNLLKNPQELKKYKALVGIKNVKLSGDLKADVNALTTLLKSREVTKAALEKAFEEIYKDFDIMAKDVVVFSTGKDGVYSPILFAKPGTKVYVRAYGTSNDTTEIADLPDNLVSMSMIMPSGIKLQTEGTYIINKDADNNKIVKLYSFTMPNRMVTGYDFIGYKSVKLSDLFSMFFKNRAK